MTVTVEGDNQSGLKDFMNKSAALGRALAAGQDALPMLAWAVVEASADISLVKDAEGEDDISRAYKSFIKAASSKAVHEHTAGGLKANISKLRQIAIAAQKPTCDFKDVLHRLKEHRAEMQQAGEKVKPAYHAQVDAARAQQDQDDTLSDEQIKATIRKPEPAEKTIEKELAAIEKRMEDLISGEKGVKYDDQDFVDAFEKVRACNAAVQLKSKRAQVLAEMQALGIQAAA